MTIAHTIIQPHREYIWAENRDIKTAIELQNAFNDHGVRIVQGVPEAGPACFVIEVRSLNSLHIPGNWVSGDATGPTPPLRW